MMEEGEGKGIINRIFVDDPEQQKIALEAMNHTRNCDFCNEIMVHVGELIEVHIKITKALKKLWWVVILKSVMI